MNRKKKLAKKRAKEEQERNKNRKFIITHFLKEYKHIDKTKVDNKYIYDIVIDTTNEIVSEIDYRELGLISKVSKGILVGSDPVFRRIFEKFKTMPMNCDTGIELIGITKDKLQIIKLSFHFRMFVNEYGFKKLINCDLKNEMNNEEFEKLIDFIKDSKICMIIDPEKYKNIDEKDFEQKMKKEYVKL